MSLVAEFDAACARANRTATSPFLALLRPDVLLVESQLASAPGLSLRVEKLLAALSQPHFALDPAATNTFMQDLAEAQFQALAASRAVDLLTLPTRASQGTPDFALNTDSSTTFEVKALSVVNGERGLREALERSLEAHIEIERQLAQGKRTALAESATAAYGSKIGDSSVNLDHLGVLLEKTRQNIKSDQFVERRSFLVLNLTALPLLSEEAEAVRPIYWNEVPSAYPVSGALWMLAFGKPGMAIFGHPEFEGKPVIEGYFSGEGILHECDFIAGIVVVKRRLDGGLFTSLLARASDIDQWSAHPLQWDPIDSLVGSCWNDEFDSNGSRL